MLLLGSKAYLRLPVFSGKKGIVYLHKSIVPLTTIKQPCRLLSSCPGDTNFRLMGGSFGARFGLNSEGTVEV